MKNLLLLFMFITFSYSLNSQVKLETKYGTVEGYIVKETDSSITLKEYSGTKYRILLNDIQSKKEMYSQIVFLSDSSFIAHIYKVDSNNICFKISTWSDSCIKLEAIREYKPFYLNISGPTYSSLGFTYGLPGMLNLFYSYQDNGVINIKFIIGYIGKIYGLEADIGFNLYRNNFFDTNIALGGGCIFGFIEDRESNSPFIVLKYNFSLYGFFAELGYLSQEVINESTYFQIGYVFRLF